MAKGFSRADAQPRRRRGYRGGDLQALRAAHARGELDVAEQGYRQLWDKGFDDPQIAEGLAAIAAARGHHEQVVHWLQLAAAAAPVSPELQFNLGMACLALQRWQDARQAFTAQVQQRPHQAEGHYGLALALQGLGLPGETAAAVQRALELAPDLRPAVILQAECLASAGQPEQALQVLQRALERQPNAVDLWQVLTVVQQRHGEHAQAVISAQRALALQPDAVDQRVNLAHVLRDAGRCEEALEQYQTALQWAPDHVLIRLNQAQLLAHLSRLDEAGQCLDRWCESRGQQLGASSQQILLAQRLLRLDALPPIYTSEQQLGELRSAGDALLSALEQQLAQLPDDQACAGPLVLEALLQFSGFARAYHLEDDRVHQQRLSAVLRRVLLANLSPWQEDPEAVAQRRSPAAAGPLKLGVAGSCLYNHNGGFWALGWLEALPKQEVSIHTYDLAEDIPLDAAALRFRALGSHRVLPMRADTLIDDLNRIQADQLDVLLLPEIGMTPASRLLSLLRLAPLQATSWGHPITSGSAAIDVFLSGALMEPAEAPNQYSEQLQLLPNLGFSFDLPPAADAASMPAVDAEGMLLVGCLQSLFKLQPRYDWFYGGLVKARPDVRWVFVADRRAAVTQVFESRLRAVFQREDLDFDRHVLILERQRESAFNALFERLCLNVDSLGWSGGNTSLRALRSGCPTVTWEAALMRGRHTAAMLRRLELNQWIATSPQDLLALASDLLADPAQLAAMRSLIRSRSPVLFSDPDAAQGFRTWLLQAKAGC